MSTLLDKILLEVSLDERVSDGIFVIENNEHISALRDYLISHGILLEHAVSITNKVVEGRFPERQAYNKDGILVTFPTPKHKAKALSRGTHFEKNPSPQPETPEASSANNGSSSDIRSPETKLSSSEFQSGDDKQIEPKQSNIDFSSPETAPLPSHVSKDGQLLNIEPIHPPSKETPPAQPPTPPQSVPFTPERREIEKKIVTQLLGTTDPVSSKTYPPIAEKLQQIKEMYEYAKNNNYSYVAKILESYVELL